MMERKIIIYENKDIFFFLLLYWNYQIFLLAKSSDEGSRFQMLAAVRVFCLESCSTACV